VRVFSRATFYRVARLFFGVSMFYRSRAARDEKLETIAAMRRELVIRDRDGLGRWMLSIPFEDYHRMLQRHPELSSKDPKVKSEFYRRFFRSEASEPYRVRDKL
jgi:hypothetical protein